MIGHEESEAEELPLHEVSMSSESKKLLEKSSQAQAVQPTERLATAEVPTPPEVPLEKALDLRLSEASLVARSLLPGLARLAEVSYPP